MCKIMKDTSNESNDTDNVWIFYKYKVDPS